MTQADHDRVPALHTAYVRLSGLNVPLTMQRIYGWEVWISKGYVEADLAIVVAHVKRRRFQDDLKRLAALRFRWLIEDVSVFEELLAEAHALRRGPQVNQAREQALRATGRATDTSGPPANSAGEIMKSRADLAKWLGDWKKENL